MSVNRGDTTAGPTDERLAQAVGRYTLGECSLSEAAEAAGVSAWELHERLSEAGVVAPEHD